MKEKITSLELAKYIINYALDAGKPISNLQLQKMLYYINIAYYIKFNEFLIKEPFYVFPQGPTNRLVYDIYRGYGRAKIYSRSKTISENLTTFDKITIDSALNQLLNIKLFDFVNFCHREDSAWYITKKTKGMYEMISETDMVIEATNLF